MQSKQLGDELAIKIGAFPEDSIILVYEDIDLNIEEERERGIVIKSYSKDSSISNILKRIKI